MLPKVRHQEKDAMETVTTAPRQRDLITGEKYLTLIDDKIFRVYLTERYANVKHTYIAQCSSRDIYFVHNHMFWRSKGSKLLRSTECQIDQAMHRLIVPKSLGTHRYACLALYRALLRQCSRLPGTVPELQTSKSLIQQKFHKYKSLQSPSQTANALKAGYEALDLLHSASQGNEHDRHRIATLVLESQSIKKQTTEFQKALASTVQPKPLSKRELKKEESRRFQEMTARRHPDATPILSRPRPVVNGRRRVPVLVSARGIPFLRIKKPQPKNLSGVIRTKLDKRWRRIERRDKLGVEILFAKDEDEWDQLTLGRPETETWAGEIKKALAEVNTQLKESDLKNKELAEAMWQVVLAERKLAAEEQTQASTKR